MIDFFKKYLFGFATKHLAEKLQISLNQAEDNIREHIRVCFDICHAAVLYENPISCLDDYQDNGIKIGKIQISSALEVDFSNDLDNNLQKIKQLSEFADSTYLHQVCEYDKKQKTQKQFKDLQEVLHQFPLLTASHNTPLPNVYQNLENKTWRIHFHVPIFVETYLNFHSTQKEIKKTLEKIKETKVCEHLEIETYTWDVLPSSLKGELVELIEKEYRWVLQYL